jgi:Nucleoside-diphosphate-sugar epimerases
MKNILITGASGFIGSFLIEEALQCNWSTWAGIRKTSSLEHLQDSRIQFIDLNFSDKKILKSQINDHISSHGKWDYVIHNAGLTKCLNQNDFEKVNYQFTRNLIEALQEIGAVPDKFILMSSLSAHAESKTAYGDSKLKAENFLTGQKKFPYIILCPTGVYGPREKDYYLVLKSIKLGLDIAAGLEIQKLTFIYVKDLVKVAFLALSSPVSDKTYAVSDGNVYTDNEYTQIAKKALGKKRILKIRVPLPLLKFVSSMMEDISKITKKPSTLNRDKYKIMAQRDWSCDVTSLQEDLGFQAEYDLNRGLAESVEWYKANFWL